MLKADPAHEGAARRLIDRLSRAPIDADPAIAEQIVALTDELLSTAARIAANETVLNDLTCRLFALAPEERALVEQGR